MTVSATLASGDSAPLPDTSAIPAFIFPSETGAGNVYQFVPGDDVHASIGSSNGTEGVLWFLRNAKQPCVVGVCDGIAGSKSAIVHVGSGPTVTAALAGSYTGPLLSTLIGLKVTTGGLNAAASIGYYLDGSGDFSQYAASVPQEGAAVLRGVVDISGGADLEGLHLDFTSPAAQVLTFAAGSLASSAAGLKAATATVVGVVVLTTSDLLDPGEAAILANPRRIIFTTAGATASDAPPSVDIVGTKNGAAVSETLILAQTAASVTSLYDYDVITSLTYPAADGTGATIAIGYSSAFATPQEIADAFNVLAIAAPLAMRARVAETATASYLELYSTSLGVGVTATIDDSASTADTPALGFTSAASNLTATGTAATLPIPFVGVTLTFASGTYIADDTYTMSTTGPSASTSAIATACDNVRADVGKPFGYLAVLAEPSSASNCRGLCNMLDARVTTWDTDIGQPIFVLQFTPGPFHTPSTTQSTNATNIATIDQALLTAFAGQTSIGTVVPGDGYALGSKVVGSYRRPALLGVAYMLSSFLLSDDPGAATHGTIPEWSLTSPDGVTLARDEANPRTVNKLGGSNGPGFTVLCNVNRLPRVKRGVTRAGQTSRLVDLGPGLRMGRRGQAVLYNTAKVGIENENYQTGADGILLPSVRETLIGVFEEDLAAALLTPPLALNASSVGVTIVTTEVIADTKTITVTATLQKLGSAEHVTIKALVAGVVKSTELS